MKYNLKTAITIVREEDRHDLIPFFEHIRWNCNIGYWEVSQIDIGDIWYIDKEGLLTFHDKTEDLSDYTILNGVPKNWREEMKLGDNTSLANRDPYEVNKDIQSKIDKLESENKELKECLSEIYKELELWVEGEKQFTSNSKALITQAKQLLNK